MSILQAKHHINASRVIPIIKEVTFNIFGQDWKLPGESTTKQNVNIVLPPKHATSNAVQAAGCNYFVLKEIGEKVFKNSEAGGKNTLHLIDGTTKKSGSKTFEAKSLMFRHGCRGVARDAAHPINFGYGLQGLRYYFKT